MTFALRRHGEGEPPVFHNNYSIVIVVIYNVGIIMYVTISAMP